MNEPIAGRPHMPGYGIPSDTNGVLPWSWAVERLEASRNYWIATVTPSGLPHSMPVWGIWHENRLHISTGADSKKARNLRANPAAVATTENASEAVIVEGTFAPQAPSLSEPVLAIYKAKYGWDDDPGGWLTLSPRKVFGFNEAPDQFGRTATRWLFD